MTTWEPGQPVRTDADVAAWKEWRKVSKREAQRARRRDNPRIDYYPDILAVSTLARLCCSLGGATYSDALNRIVADWTEPMPPE